jgi:hypothetical protein
MDTRQRAGVEAQIAFLDAQQVEDRHNAADNGREQDQLGFGQTEARLWLVGRAEIDGARGDLRKAGTRAYRLVIDTLASGGLVVGGSLGIERRRESRAGAIDRLRVRSGRRQQGNGRNECFVVKHTSLGC